MGEGNVRETRARRGREKGRRGKENGGGGNVCDVMILLSNHPQALTRAEPD